MSNEAKNKPIKQFKAGALGVSAWQKRSSVDGSFFYNATPSRVYKDDKKPEGEQWQYTDSFSRDDLPIIAALLNQAFSWICATEAKAKEQAAQ